ncbi:MAG: DUF1275 family protein [Planctomycetes bacterium]|nr:DUF1275 family protein [Planctomycetota bacterium]MCC7396959.1 DUF1275 family protein [Planctomycetota bacterium]
MFRSRAHSFTQQARLAISLSWIAGYTNALTILECHQVTSHVTGTLSQIGVTVVEGNTDVALYLVGLAATFLAGAFTSGMLLELGRIRRFRSIFVLPMTVEAVLLAAFALLVERSASGHLTLAHPVAWMTFLPTFAMGMQNAAITRISGGVVRTTHVTGVVTDLGLELARLTARSGHRSHRVDLRHRQQERLRVLLLLGIIGSFVFGGTVGTALFDHLERWSMVPAVLFLVSLVVRDRLRPIAPIELRTSNYRGAPIIAVYHAEPPKDASPGYMPDLQSWAERLDDHVRVVVLDIAAMPELDDNAAHEVHLLMVHLRGSGRTLVVAGVGQKHLAVLRHCGVLQNFDPDELCEDIESAIEYAEDLAETL